MTIAAGLLRAVGHELFDVAVASGVLALLALAVGRIRGVDAGARSRCWSAVAIIPLLAFAAAVLQPMAFREAANRAVPAPIAGAVLIDPLDALQLRAGTANAPAFGAPTDATILVETPRSRPFPWLAVTLALWIAVAAFRLAHVFLSVVRAHRVVARSSPASTASAAGVNLLGVARDAANARVELRVCDVLGMPVAVGLAHRAVVVPARLASGLPAGELRAVVLHEIAHLQRRDDWVYLLERIACAVLWFDPILFAAARASANCREVACDARAAQSTGARTCATALWRSASIVCGGESRGAALALLSGGALLDRVEALLHPAATSARRAIAAGAAFALLAASVGALVVVRAPAYALPSGLGATGSMRTRRASFASVKLRDGRVLVAGGMIANHDFTRAAELYDPARGTFEPTGALSDGRTGLSGTLLADGRVLVAGGWTSNGVTNATEIYDPATGRFMRGVPMRSSRAGHTVTPLRDGMLLIAGGVVRDNEATASAELYDPRRNTFTSVAPMPQARVAHTATLLVDGRVLIAGGLDGVAALRSTLLYDPAARTFSAGPQMLEPRSKHGAALLSDGTVLIAGGGRDASWRERLDDTERYDEKANRFVASAAMHVRRFKIEHALVRLPNGDVLVAGGGDRAELYDAAHDHFRLIDGSMGNARNLGAAVLLDDGSVLIAGGYDSVDPLPTTETAQRYRTERSATRT